MGKMCFIKALKIAELLFKDKSIANHSFVKLFSKDGFLYLSSEIHYHAIVIPIGEYSNSDGDIDVILDISKLSNSIKHMNDDIFIKESQDKNYLYVADGTITLKFVNYLYSNFNNSDFILSNLNNIKNEESNLEIFEKDKMLKCITHLKNSMTKDVFDKDSVSSVQMHFNGFCCFIRDRKYITRFDYETNYKFSLNSMQYNLIQAILKNSHRDVQNFKIIKEGKNMHFYIGNILFSILNSDFETPDISNITQSFNHTDYFNVRVDTLISNLNTAKTLIEDKLMLEVTFSVKANRGVIKAVQEDVLYSGKFVAENGVDSEFLVSIDELINLLNSVKSLENPEKVRFLIDGENELLSIDYGFGDSFIAIEYIF